MQSFICDLIWSVVTSQVRSKVIFIIWHSWHGRTKQPCQIETKPMTGMDRAWDTAKYPPAHLVTSFQVKVIQCPEVKKLKLIIFGLDGMMHIYRKGFFKIAKMTIEKLLKGPNRAKLRKRICQNYRIWHKKWLFWYSKWQNSAYFPDVYLKICTHIFLQLFFHIYSVSDN